MMYESKMVCCLKANGKVLREHKDTVYVPFGTEYSVLLKNLNSVRALVKIEIDGTDVSDGTLLVVNANSEFELTRFIKNGNLKAGNRFKFIERSAGVEAHRGVGIEDGIIRVEFQFERQLSTYVPPYCPDKVYYRNPGHYPDLLSSTWTSQMVTASYTNQASPGVPLRSFDMSYSASATSNISCNASAQAMNMSTTNASVNDAGITVPGSKSDQEFKTVSDFPVEATKHVMVLKLLGETDTGKRVVQPVTVKTKPKCVTCARVNKAGAKFCTDCGTALEIV